MTERRYATASRALLRDTLLRATDELVAERGWPAVTMAQVAAAAGVSRQTVYNEVGGRDDLARAYALWAADQLLDDVERCLAAHRDDMVGALVAALEMFLDEAADHPLVRALRATTGREDLVGLLMTPDSAPLVVAATVRLGGIIAATWPEVGTAHPELVDLVGEHVVRLAISHVVLPTVPAPEAAARAGALLAPLLATLPAPAPTPRP